MVGKFFCLAYKKSSEKVCKVVSCFVTLYYSIIKKPQAKLFDELARGYGSTLTIKPMQNNEKISLFANDVNAPIKVELHDNGQYFVSARELHAFLGSQAQFTNWADRIFESNFVKGKDYFEVYNKNVINPKGGRPSIDYWLTFRCAQHIGMMQNNAKGFQIRDYFIDCEDRLKQVQALIAQAREETLAVEIKKLASRVEDVEQKYAWLLSAHEELAESVRDILDEMPHAQVLFEILLER
ncbi:MAG: hypothetical protein EAZ95_18795, partial [Bacteroidetes bacterium]